MVDKITSRADWLGPDIAKSGQWVRNLNAGDIADIDDALAFAKSRGAGLGDCRVEDFPLAGFGAAVAAMLGELENGFGLYLFRGLPVEKYSADDLRLIFWGIGLHAGAAVSQSKRGDLLGDVRDIGTRHDGPEFRGYTSNGELTYHTDAADVTALFCLRPAKTGGLSRIVSAPAVHNRILDERPDLLEVLYEPFHWSRQGNELQGQPAHYRQPIFAVHDGHFASRYTRTHIRSAETMASLPGLSPEQGEALDLIDDICARPEFHLTMMFEPGDMQFLNNHLTYHTRTAFEDFDEPGRKRHLLRLWLAPPNSRPLASGFAEFFGDVSAGAVRGGFPGHSGEAVFTTI